MEGAAATSSTSSWLTWQRGLLFGGALVAGGACYYLYRVGKEQFYVGQFEYLSALAKEKHQNNEHLAAASLLRDAIKIARKAKGSGPISMVMEVFCRQQMYLSYRECFEYNAARKQAIKCWGLLQRLGVPESDMDTSEDALSALLLRVCFRHDFDLAIRCYKRLKVLRQGNHSSLASTAGLIASMYILIGDLERAMKYLHKAQKGYSRAPLLSDEDKMMHQILIPAQQTEILRQQGNYAAAKEVHSKIEAFAQSQGETLPIEFQVQAAILEGFLGNTEQADRTLKVLLKDTKLHDESMVAYMYTLDRCADYYRTLGHEQRARKMDKKMQRVPALTPPSRSRYFEGSFCAFVYKRIPDESSPTKDRVALLYCLVLTLVRSTPGSSLFITIEYENPMHPDEPIREEREVCSDDISRQFWKYLQLKSPPIEGLRVGRKYKVVVHVYKDSSREEKLGEHHQLMQLNFPPKKWLSKNETMEGIKEDFELQ